MENTILHSLRKEYEKKRMDAIIKADSKREELFTSYPRLQKIEDELHKLAFSTAKSILSSGSPTAVSEFSSSVSSLRKEKETLLKQLGISIHDLDPNFECTICKDTGYITENAHTSMCNCLKQRLLDLEYNRSNISNIEHDTFSNFNLTLYSDQVDTKKYLADISPRENMRIIKEVAENFIKNFNLPEEKNLLLRGNTGLGKTFLSNCIANELLKQGKTVLYQTAPVMLDAIIDYRFGKSSSNMMEQLLHVDLLIIDDLGTECMNSMKFAELFNVLNTRLLTSTHKTIISTNLTMKNLFATYDERIVSRIIGYYRVLPFFGEDLRFKK